MARGVYATIVPGTIFAEMDIIQNSGIILAPGYSAVIPLKSELVMGDGNTGSDIFDGVGFRGVRLYSSDNMYPDSQQGFAPTVDTSDPRTATQLTIRQNGFIIYQSYVSPVLKLLICTRHLQMAIWMSPSTSAMAISRIHNSVFNSADLQREGRFKFDLTAGDFRSGNSSNHHLSFSGHGTRWFTTRMPGLRRRDYLPITPPLLGLGRNLGTGAQCRWM